jgi:hypothetical protein
MEKWKPVKGYEGLYEVSNFGRVKALTRRVDLGKCHRTFEEHFLSLATDHKGYLRCALSHEGTSKTFKVHRLVAEAFIPNPDNKEQVNHIDGNKTNNRVDNLEWCTRSENMHHACVTKLKRNNGEYNNGAKLTYKEVVFIRTHYIPRDKVYGTVALANKFGVHRKTISRIITGRYWKEGDADVKSKIV